jgi:hypothetical protein
VTFDTPSQLTTIPDCLFSGCKCLKTLTLPDSITAIAASAFRKSGVTSIIGSDWTIIAGLVVRLGKVFCCLGTPSSIRIPGSVREIGHYAFAYRDSLIDLSFEEGILKIGVSAFRGCYNLEKAALPASLFVIEANAFRNCRNMRQITFAVGSQLQYIRSGAFQFCPLNQVVIPASIVKIDPSAFSDVVWPYCLKYEGPPLFLIDDHFMRLADSRVLFSCITFSHVFFHASSYPTELLIGSNIEVIGNRAFRNHSISTILFESGTRLREIRIRAFAGCQKLKAFKVPESVEIIGAHCFSGCAAMETIEFEGLSRLKRIERRIFAGCILHSITIPALTEEIDGSAFVNCPLTEIKVAPGNPNFKIEGNLLVTVNGREIVRYFGLDRDIIIGKNVQILRKSCFESCKHVDGIDFEIDSELAKIRSSALRNCVSLSSIDIPASVTIIEEASFEGCNSLESCLIAKDSFLVAIGARAFARCTSLRSFDIPPLARGIGSRCFEKCFHLYRVKFRSSKSLKMVMGHESVDEALDKCGMMAHSGLFRIDVEDGEIELKFPGWVSVRCGEEDLHSSLVRDFR